MSEKEVIADNLKRLRAAAHLTQDNVAEFLGVRRSAYANYEAGEREVPLDVMEKTADLFGCDLYDLYAEDKKSQEKMLATAFRVNDLSVEDMQQIAAFKGVVKNYLKMNQMLS